MNPPHLFALDANIFITAAEKYYAFDLVPMFWDTLISHGNAGQVFTIDRIANEITGATPLKAWMDGPFAGFVRNSNTPETLTHYGELMQWAQTQPFMDAAKSEFATVADAWLVAYSKAVGATIVTHERYAPDVKRTVKIPNACRFLGVPCVDTFAMLRALGVKLGK